MKLNVYIMLGAVLIIIGLAYPFLQTQAVVQVDTTPPIITQSMPTVNVTYVPSSSQAWTVTCDCYDPDESGTANNGISTVYMDIDGVPYALNAPPLGYTVWTKNVTSPAVGTHSLNLIVTNNAGLSTTLTGTFSIYISLQGTWYINNKTIISSSQIIYSTSSIVQFKFVVSSGTVISASIKEGTNTLVVLTKASDGITYTGQYTFTNGKHTLSLVAWDGIVSVTMNVISLDTGGTVNLAWLTLGNSLMILGTVVMGFGFIKQRGTLHG